MDNSMHGFYIAPAFMEKVVAHITKNFMNLPNIKVCYLSLNHFSAEYFISGKIKFDVSNKIL